MLNSPEGRAAHVRAAIEQNDPGRIAKAIGQVAQAIGTRAFAKQTGLSASAIYKAFIHDGGNPTLKTLSKALDAIGLEMSGKAKT